MPQIQIKPAPRGVPALLVADHPALDFLNSVASPLGEPLDWITNGQALCAWLLQSDLLDAEEMQRIKAQLGAEELDAAASQARSLREWMREVIQLRREGGWVSDFTPLHAALADHWERPVFDPAGWRRHRDLRSSTALIGPVGEVIGDFLITADFTRVRQCEGEGCTLWFIDVSKANRRRWCSMTVCGNRTKVAAHRARRKPKGASVSED